MTQAQKQAYLDQVLADLEAKGVSLEERAAVAVAVLMM